MRPPNPSCPFPPGHSPSRPRLSQLGVFRPGVFRLGVFKPGVFKIGGLHAGILRPGVSGPGRSSPGLSRPVRTGRPASRPAPFHLGVAVLAAWLAGCATLNPPEPPRPQAAPAATAPTPAALDRWWERFDDPALNALVDESLRHNLDLRAAAARVREAKALTRLARAAQFPSVNLNTGAFRTRATEIGPNPLPPGFAASTTGYQLNVDLAYEADVWGRFAAGTRAAAEDLNALRAQENGARASLAAAVARAYFQLRGVDAQLALARRTLASRSESLGLIERREAQGFASGLELAQARAERDTARTTLPPLEQAAAQLQAALALLAGHDAGAVFAPEVARGAELAALVEAPEVPAGLDAELLTRRPDVIAASAAVLAADWRLREARASFFPRLSLTGLLGYESGQLTDLITTPARVGQIALGALQPLIGLASLSAAREVADARRAQSLIAYEAAARSAFRETHDALVAVRQTAAAQAAQRERLASVAQSLKFASLRFDAGYSAYLEVLDAQRLSFAAESDLISARQDRLLAAVDLFLALGGGWETGPAQAAPRPTDG